MEWPKVVLTTYVGTSMLSFVFRLNLRGLQFCLRLFSLICNLYRCRFSLSFSVMS